MRTMIASLMLCRLVAAQAVNPVTNGGFETLAPNGFPEHWETVGRQAEIVTDARSGDRALLLRRTQEAVDSRWETGLNRRWRMDSGEQGSMLAVPKGGIRFWYKVLAGGPGAVLKMNAIAMDERPFEGCNVPRASYQVPQNHIGDGTWHEGVLAFDFSENKRFRWLQVSPRVTGPAGTEWVLDDIHWVESVGPLPAILSLKIYELPGGDCQVRCLMANSGDARLAAGEVVLTPPAGLTIVDSTPEQPVRTLEGDTFAIAAWRLRGPRPAGTMATARFTAAGRTVESTCAFEPAMDWIQFQAERCVLCPGQETTVEVVVYNRGTAVLPRVRLEFVLPPELNLVGRLPTSIEDVPPAAKAQVSFGVSGELQTPTSRIECSWRIPGGRSGTFATEIVVAAPRREDRQTEPRVTCGSFEIVFPKNEFGYGVGWVYAKKASPRLVGVVPNLGRLTMKGGPEGGMPLMARKVQEIRGVDVIGAPPGNGAGLRFEIDPSCLKAANAKGPMFVDLCAVPDADATAAVGRAITCRVTAPAPPEGTLLALDTPALKTLDGGKDEALVPGMEWILGDEGSSNDNVIAHDHPHRLRWRQHPHLVTIPMMSVRRKDVVTALFWHPRATWNNGTRRADLEPGDADTDRPTPVFAAPDRFAGHACASMGLSVPTISTYGKPNQPAAEQGWPAPGVNATRIDLSCAFYVSAGADSALDALKAWFELYGIAPPRTLPQQKALAPPLPPSTLFRGPGLPAWAEAAAPDGRWTPPTRPQWTDELEWSMQAYLGTLWDDDMTEWRVFHGGPPVQRRTGAFAHYLYDCVTTAKLTDDTALRKKLDDLSARVVRTHDGPLPVAGDFGFLYADPLSHIHALDTQVVSLMKTQDTDGGWRYHTRVEQGGVFKGRDYAGLGHDGYEANGLVARNAWTLLQGYRLTGDKRLLEAGLKALRYMEKFRVPRAAQVWEVVAHAPDILAAADACQAYIEGYKATGDKRLLERAVYWAWAGIPFVYQWGIEDFRWMRYGSIPIFGSTWWTCTWFGRPVQWNGLRLAFALAELNELDQSFPWMTVANGITISALYQQGFDPENTENYALWPDVYDAVSGQRIEWNFAPRGIILNLHKLMGFEPVPRTRVLETGNPETPIRVSGCARFLAGSYQKDSRTAVVLVEDCIPLNGRILVAGVTEPESVRYAERELRRVEGNPEEPGTWCYDAEVRAAVAFPPPSGKSELRVLGVRPVASGFTPEERTSIDFSFNGSAEGWKRAHDMSVFSARRDVLHIETNGIDPYMIRGTCAIDGNTVRSIRVRMAATAGTGAQFFWTTAKEPAMAEDRRVDTDMTADGEFHDVVFAVGTHPKWRGQTITSIRLDPVAGADKATVKIDSIQGEE